jgi:endonuclease III
MNNKTYIKLKEKYETELIDLTKTALLETDIDSLDSLVKKIYQTNGKASTLKSLFGKINEDEDGNHVLKDSDGCIQHRF